MAGGYKMHVWEVSVVEQEREIKADAHPGQILAMTGKGMWIQCGKGQLKIIDASIDELEHITPYELLAPVYGGMPTMLG